MFDTFFSHPNKLYTTHITNMLDSLDTPSIRGVKLYHDIAKLKNNFQLYIREPQKNIKGKNHSLLSAYLFLVNFDFKPLEMLFGFFAISSHHNNLENFMSLKEPNRYLGEYFENSKELEYIEEVIQHAKTLSFYPNIRGNIKDLVKSAKRYRHYLMKKEFIEDGFSYEDFIEFKSIYSALIYSDKYEAIFNITKEQNKKINSQVVTNYINNLPKIEKRAKFREFVLSNFNKNKRLFTLTAPTGYGKTLTSLEFALKFKKQKIIYALPFTSIIDQTYEIFSEIFKNEDINIFKIHHKTTIDEDIDEDRYSKVKFLLNSFSGEINIATLYQLIFTFFGNNNKDNVKFNQLKNSVVIIDEAQALPYTFRQDFIKLCKIISQKLDTIFIFMSATMPVVKDFKELSNLEFFKNQNRYKLKWLPLENKDESLKEKIKEYLGKRHTLCVANTIKKAQELYLYFKNKNTTYCLNSYMCDIDKQATIKKIKEAIKEDKEKILLISTQTIEAGVDLDFEVGFREISPISSIIQTAGRVNRNFGKTQATLYIFEDISGYSDKIYGDLQLISKSLFELLKNKEFEEKDILELSRLYFQKIHNQLEKELLEEEMEKLAFFDINRTIKEQMRDDFEKELLVIEPKDGFIQQLQEEIYLLQNSKAIDKFAKIDRVEKVVKKMLKYAINVSKNDLMHLQTRPNKIKGLTNILYLPYGNIDYDRAYGLKKYTQSNKEEIQIKDFFD